MTEEREEHFVITRYKAVEDTSDKYYWEAFSLRQAMKLYEHLKQKGADEVQICRVEYTYEKPVLKEQTDD